MSFVDYLHKVPALRLIIPLIGGIAVGDYFFFDEKPIPPEVAFGAASIFFIAFFSIYSFRKYQYRWVPGAFVVGLFFFLGCGWCTWQLQQTHTSFAETETVYNVRLSGNPEQKAKSWQCKATCEGKTVLLYFPPDSTVASLRAGDELLISARISLPLAPKNPDEFDYRKYLLRKGISGTGYVATDHWKFLTHRTAGSIRQAALMCRYKVLELYRSAGFSGDNMAILSALTVGYKEELSEEIRDAFSVAGVSHVLALSGMHVTIISGMLLFMLNRIRLTSRVGRFARTFIVLVLLWFFAFIAGLSASVVRAVIMFSLLILSQEWNRQNTSVNTLLFTALFMLCYQPGWLFDVGFQLSFMAVIGILFLNPWLSGKLPVKNVFASGVWGAITVSLSAQIATTPFVLLYFSKFPTHFLITNLLIVPILIPLILYLAVIMLVLTPVTSAQLAVAYVLEQLLNVLTGIVKWVEQLPYSSLSGIWVYPLEVFLVYLLVILMVVVVRKRRGKYVLALLVTAFVLVGYRSTKSWTDRPGNWLVFYHLRQAPAFHCISSSGESWLSVVDSVSDVKQIERSASGYWNRLRMDVPKVVSSDYKSDLFNRKGQLASFGGKRIATVNDHSWLSRVTDTPFPIDILYVCRGYNQSLSLLLNVFSAKRVILDTSLPEYLHERFTQECVELGLECNSLKEGYLKIEL